MCIAGPRRSGKSHLIKSMLKNELKKKFKPENIFIFCPSIDLNDDFKEFSQARKFNEPKPEIINDIMRECQHNIKVYGKQRTPNVLIIFDDCLDTNIMKFNGILDKIASRGRHMKISMIAVSQRISGISRTIRLNSDYFLIFSPFNLSESEQFLEQYVLKRYRKEMGKIILDIWKKKHSFIFVDNSEYDSTKKIKEGFDKVIQIMDSQALSEE